MTTYKACCRVVPTGAVAALLIVAGACGRDSRYEPTRRPATPPEEERAELPAQLADPATRPPADLFLPPLDGYITDDADPGELEESLAHGPVPYVEVRRRLILDEQGFTSGVVTVVTFEPDTGAVELYLDHQYGNARRGPIEIEGIEMLRIEAQPHAVLAWTGPAFVVTFERGQEITHAWLEDLARATVTAVAPR